MINDILQQLNIKPENSGVSTGTVWLEATGDYLLADSPVDGQVISKVKAASRKDYDTVIEKATAPCFL